MKFLNKMERKLGRYAIHNLSLYIIITYVIGYALQILAPNVMFFLNLEPALILRGQVWRLVSWILIPPESLDLFTIIMLMLYFSLGSSLERTWGAFRYNLYIFMGLIASVIGAFILYFCGVRILGFAFSTYYINLSIFLAFALSYPEERVYLYFLIPIKMKWMGFFYLIITVYQMINSNWAGRVVILASLANFIIYFLMTRNMKRVSPKEIRRKQNFHRQIQRATPSGVTKHKCAICGRTELDGDDLEFRFCSKCDGNYEYCQDHLFTHTHVRNM
jgi:hypothetical protein